ncbi:VOC family protein [Phenylobacterium sp. J367]|uniref:VOC family protein n=1 Tax=Phenylobacterium sp. J367 TaxID=2898435 RepID=UPI00215110A0|nr:VOC family protein [Phenylobacterium sp. J367]MCR5880474.1 VOC family protein [Phenylobacterium sp. J367]
MEQRLSLITLGVADMARARRFYENGLGWTAQTAMDEVCFYELRPGFGLALFLRHELEKDAKRPIDGTFSGITLALNERCKADVDATFAQAEAAGATITKPPEDAAWGGYSGYFSDPDGHTWEVAWNPQCVIGEDGSTTFGAG